MMTYTVHFRRADGKATKVFLSGLNRGAAEAARDHKFRCDPTITMCWVLDEHGNMLGDALEREAA